ncbi:MAG: 2-methylisocitrate lyase-like PEP mutase family enzyme [Burkholderiaceae bacterium]|jgi:2-methylisocitrate lyase-like PEP mutase family enzyme
MTNNTSLKQILTDGEFVIAPGVFDMFSARIADQLDFKALYMTGYGVSASYLGLADAGLITYTEMVARAGTIAQGISKPLIADADTGFGGLLNLHRTIRGYEAAGVQAIQFEDQQSPKKCGHTPGRQVIPLSEMLQKIEVACDARRSKDTLIIARTDARTSLGLDEAIRRGKAFAKAGADIVFIESPETAEEFRRVGGEVDAWLLANMVPSGMSPEIASDTLRKWGFNIAIYPALGMSVAAASLAAGYQFLQSQHSTIALDVPAYSMQQLHVLMGFPEVWEFERRHATTGS